MLFIITLLKFPDCRVIYQLILLMNDSDSAAGVICRFN